MTSVRAAASSQTGAFAAVLILGQLVVRGILVARGDFYWDDLIIIGQASSNPILSWDYLGNSHDGHFMPAAYLLAGITTVLAPVQWWLPAVTLVVLQAIASIAVWRMIRVLAPGAGLGALAALAFYLFVPMTVPAYVWWAAGLNTLPMQAAMAVVVAAAVSLTRDEQPPARRRRLLVRSVLVFVVALAFFEKSLYIAPVALVAAWLAAPGRLRRARALWAWLGGIVVVWTVLYLAVADPTDGEHSLGQTWALTWRSVGAGLVPAVAGGPWQWDRWTTAPPMGEPSAWLTAAGWVLLAGAALGAGLRRRGGARIVVCVAAYAVAAQLPVMWNRSSAATAVELGQTMRYLPDTALVMTIGIALLAAAPGRVPDRVRDRVPEWVPPVVAARVPAIVLTGSAVLLVVSSLIATASFSKSWDDDPTGAYLATARAALAAEPELVLLDQSLPLEVLTPVAYPENQTSRVFGRLRVRPRFADQTDDLKVLDEYGHLVPGGISPVRQVQRGRGTCAEPVTTERQGLQLSGPLLDWHWTAVLDYCADRDGEVAAALDGVERRIQVQAGRHRVYFQLVGGGEQLRLRPVTPDLTLYVDGGRIGEPIVAAYAP
ncbi:hypothetical protein GOHSU_20_00400 [Gordonia hirsuta DSM 44140 = NBRC 16056]|uniref:Glycosyltransferase RgtA/B/C/D-like domain-containing protein n=1 Tax=Gordonia hirsuta DSM 44140 = NBRC 16056 TaxID=1121927 RepID=L7LBR9_9ACTN|nr:hypothetical protein [Gordonia hirsuta]GAC57502.1 hypothetical protein GOHSU_20_00400 [Gordonia hirsuta DSM 44140 = NBRC 16056]